MRITLERDALEYAPSRRVLTFEPDRRIVNEYSVENTSEFGFGQFCHSGDMADWEYS